MKMYTLCILASIIYGARATDTSTARFVSKLWLATAIVAAVAGPFVGHYATRWLP